MPMYSANHRQQMENDIVSDVVASIFPSPMVKSTAFAVDSHTRLAAVRSWKNLEAADKAQYGNSLKTYVECICPT